MKLVRTNKPKFQLYHGMVLRAGNTAEDIGKPAVDILRLSEKPIMVLKGHLTVNRGNRFRQVLAERGVKETDRCTEEKLLMALQV